MDPTLPVSTQPTSPLSSITPVDPEKPVSKIWLWIVGGILLLGVGIVGGVVLGKQLYSVSQPQPISQPNPSPIVESTPAPDSTASQASNSDLANWKTYTNTKYGYSLKYEPNSELKQLTCSLQKADKGEDVFILDENASTFPECGFGGYSWPISITPQGNIQDCNSTESWQSTRSEIKISGIDAIKCVQKFIGQMLYPGPDEITWVGLKYNSKFFVFNLSNSKYQSTFDQILSTFHFSK